MVSSGIVPAGAEASITTQGGSADPGVQVAPITNASLAVRAADAAAARGGRLSDLLKIEPQSSEDAGKCSWRLAMLDDLLPDERSAVAWLIAEAVLRSRGGRSTLRDEWRQAAVTGTRLAGIARTRHIHFTSTVFGMPDEPGTNDHVEGHVAEWFWYLLLREWQETHRTIALIDPPKFSVTEPGPDGFVVYTVNGAPMVFRLWEIKKHTGADSATDTVREACVQLRRRGGQYIAQLVGIHSDKDGDLGDLVAQMADLWIEVDARAGAGVSVTSATLPAPPRCFASVGEHLPQFKEPGQLEGLFCAIDGYREIAQEVRRFLWMVL